MNELSLFTGAGGGLMGTKLLGWRNIGYVEWNEYCQQVIRARVDDGSIDEAPIFTDVREFVLSGAAREYRGFADVVTAGFPCQPFSHAGKRGSEADDRNMWPATLDVLCETRPKYAYLENVAGLLSVEYIRTIFADLAAIGFDARWGSFSAEDRGAPITRKRLFIACANKVNGGKGLGYSSKTKVYGRKGEKCPPFWLQAPPVSFGVEHGLDSYVDQVEAIGNGQCPQVVAAAWRTLIED